MKSMKRMKGKASNREPGRSNTLTRSVNGYDPDRYVQPINLHALHVLRG